MHRLSIDRDLCTGHGRCYDLAHEVIEPDDEGMGRVTVADVPDHLHDTAMRAVLGCPERAITLATDHRVPEEPT